MGDRILVVDDEADVVRLLAFNLGQAGYEVLEANTGADALLLAAKKRPVVIVLDLMLPDIGGLELCRKIRQDEDLGDTGILMLTARGDDADRVEGLAAGADDYVVKPFNVDEIVLRVGALCRRLGESRRARTQSEGAPKLLRCGEITIDPQTHETRVGGEIVSLRPLEYKLLCVLVSAPEKVFSREELIRDVWDMEHVSSSRLVDVHIRRLRQNLGAAAASVETVPGFGYRARSGNG